MNSRLLVKIVQPCRDHKEKGVERNSNETISVTKGFIDVYLQFGYSEDERGNLMLFYPGLLATSQQIRSEFVEILCRDMDFGIGLQRLCKNCTPLGTAAYLVHELWASQLKTVKLYARSAQLHWTSPQQTFFVGFPSLRQVELAPPSH